jgi:hypothetical protein
MCGRYQRRSDKQRIAEAFAPGNNDAALSEPSKDQDDGQAGMFDVSSGD